MVRAPSRLATTPRLKVRRDPDDPLSMPNPDPMAVLIALAVCGAAMAVLHCVAVSIRQGEAAHDLRVRVHDLHRAYVAKLRGEDIIEVDIAEPVGQIEPDPGAESGSGVEQKQAA
ncbi:MAG: hypothetical protein AAGB48_04830 [Planctomycetota bacterium]